MAQGVDDYLHQAADPDLWADGIFYDPEDTGNPISSLGVHEHWNNTTEMQYSGNLGTASGIYLVKILNGEISSLKDYTVPDQLIASAYPNPSSGHITISAQLEDSGVMSIDLLDMSGRLVKNLEKNRQVPGAFQKDFNIGDLESGSYIYRITLSGDKGEQYFTGKFELLK